MNGHPGHPDDLAAAMRWLASFTDWEQKLALDKMRASLDLERMRALCAHFGNPESRPQVVHVAGSKGKGSTVHLIDQALRSSGLRTGRFISPHLVRINERIAIDGLDIADAALAERIHKIRPYVDGLGDDRDRRTPSFFECLTLAGFLAFAEHDLAFAVIEVGLGGRLDATNVVDPAVAVITTLDLEHTRILGSTLPEIAAEKAGIIKPGRPCVSATEADSPAGKVIARIAAERGARLLVIGREIEIRRWAEHAGGNRFDLRIEDRRLVDVSLGARGRHQTVNAALAIAALHLLESDGRIRFDEDRIRLALARPRLPARLELFPPRGERRHPVLLDCAHTPSSMAAFTAVSAELFGDDRPDVLIGMLVDKLHERCLETLRGTVRRVAVTAPPSPRALPAPELARIVQRVVAPERIEVVDSPLPWLDARAADPHPLAVIGSVYLAGLVRGHLV